MYSTAATGHFFGGISVGRGHTTMAAIPATPTSSQPRDILYVSLSRSDSRRTHGGDASASAVARIGATKIANNGMLRAAYSPKYVQTISISPAVGDRRGRTSASVKNVTASQARSPRESISWTLGEAYSASQLVR